MGIPATRVLVAYVALTALSSLVAYTLSVSFGHVDSFSPYLGDIGDKPLESTIFTQCFVIDACFFSCVVQIRFVYVSHRLSPDGTRFGKFAANEAGACAGHAAAIGLFVLACFQESNAFYVHNAAAFFFLVSSVTYFTLQTHLSKVTASTRRVELVFKIRMFLNAFMFLFFLLFFGGYAIAFKQFQKPWEDRYHWSREDGGWLPHVLSAGSEWLMILLFQCYLLTFYSEFQNVVLTKTRIIVLPEVEAIETRPVRT